MHYLDFDLEIGPGSGRDYPLAVQHSPAGEERGVLRFPFDEELLASYLTKLQAALLRSGGRRRALSPEEQAVREFGQRLFEALLPDVLRSLYYESRREAVRRGMGIRLRLRVLAPELAALPWEYLYDQRQGDYLCLSNQTPLVRYVEMAQFIEPLAVTPPLRILAMIASPSDQDPLDVAREQERMHLALQAMEQEGLVHITWLAGQTWRHLHREMHRGPWHVFHFIGHGGFDPTNNEGLIALASDDGKTHLLAASDLSRLLANHPSLRLVVLNACEGAKGSQRDLFSSTAASLARRGIPAVLAMQEVITDHAAIECTRAFYEALADGLPVDAAVAEARMAISLGLEHTLEWGTPVLYMRSPDGTLFDLPPDRRRSSLPIVLAALLPPARVEEAPAPPDAPIEQPPAPPALEEDPNATQIGRGLVLPEKTGQDWLEEGQAAQRAGALEQALALYDGGLQQNADFWRLHAAKGAALSELGRFEEALAAYEQAIALAPNREWLYNDQGLALHALKRYQEAVASFEQALRLNATFASASNNLGDALRELERPEEALAAYEQAIALDPTRALFHNNRGCALLDLHRPAEALSAYEQAIRLSQDYAIAHRNKGEVLEELGRAEDALAEYEWALELAPADTYALHCKGAVLRELGRRQGALAAYERLLQLDPEDDLAYTSKGAVLEELQRYQEALTAYDQALRLKPLDGFAWLNKGRVLGRLGLVDEALEATQRASELGV